MTQRFGCWLVFGTLFIASRLWGDDDHTAQSPLPPGEAAATMNVPDGFQVTLFAGEPDVVQPISFCIDDRGRVWVAEAYSYPNHTDQPGRDRILIFEDLDHDGRFDRRKVFYEGLNYVTGVEVGFGGAWVMSPPYFYFIADRNTDDVPDGPPEVVLDGFGNHANAHNLANGFAWGPDGWLYGTHGRTNWSKVGKPGTPDDQRIVYDGGVYRFHPVTRVWEPYADGTTNPWGIDWDDYGQAFVCNCVNPHLFHAIQGAHYEPWRNRASSQYAYARIDTIADHLHFAGIANIRDGLGSHEEDEMGGGHAHCGTMVYLGDNWPKEYRNTVFMNNIHGRRINNDILQRKGSGYTASHGRDLMKSADPWFMGVTLTYGPDGCVFASDWSDTGECHSVKNTRRHTGRIYRIAFGTPGIPITNLPELDSAELAGLQLHENDWYVRHARRLLQERAAAGQSMSDVHQALHRMFSEQNDVPRKLRALWTLFATSGASDEFLISLLSHESESIRAWAVTLLGDDRVPPSLAIEQFSQMGHRDNSPVVRLQLAALLQRIPPQQAWTIAEGLVQHSDDAHDQNLPLMYWYGIEPLVHHDIQRFAQLLRITRIPLLRQFAARRMAELSPNDEGLQLLCGSLAGRTDSQQAQDILSGMLTGLEGQRTVRAPASWPVAYKRVMDFDDASVRDQAVRLALIFDDQAALKQLQTMALSNTVPAADRIRAVNALVTKQVVGLDQELIQLLKSPEMRSAALRGLAEFHAAETPAAILAVYSELSPAERQVAINTLTSRTGWAMKLLDAVEAQKVPLVDLNAFAARQLRSLGDERLTKRVNALWGEVRETSADRARLIADFKKKLTPEIVSAASLAEGKLLFSKHCALCHKFFGEGGTIGPDITGAQRTNLDYLLENLLDPSAAVARDFQMQLIATTSGRTITGLVVSESPMVLTIQTATEKLTIPVEEIEDRKQSNVSMMPDGLLNTLTFEQVRNLFGYLQQR